ncbi:hypothetical protein MtrunA17_Chr6g0478611 [Medicago truncatula]|uniref:Uncharacterized protein n=1 Tax=Medicago truncatula TaxID=3880 RepID=A0A396HLS4_MEDTR|nr:hypothetical protein MtrunA17_Chr6g0478611 [Medicago truncatula]
MCFKTHFVGNFRPRYLTIKNIIKYSLQTQNYIICGCSALKGGIPTSNSNKMTPTDHQSAVYAAKFEQIFCRCYVSNKIHKNT